MIPLVAQTREVPAEFMAVVPEVVMELVIGLAIGFALRLVFAAIELGAQVISLQMGLGFAELIDPGWCIRTYAQPVLRDVEHLNVSCAQRASHAHRTACAELYLAADWR